MRIMHIATLVTPDGAYGGPIRVAENQLAELARRGHEVEFVAGSRGLAGPPGDIAGVRQTYFPARTAIPKIGFAGLWAPGLVRYVRSRIKEVDVVHIHVARDLVTMPAAVAVLNNGVPLVLQPHGMVDESSKALAHLFDLVATRRVFRSSREVLALTPRELKSIRTIARTSVKVSLIPNGVPAAPSALVDRSDRSIPEVLFLSRLHPRKRPTLFVEMAKTLLDEGVEASFALVGPDEGEGGAVKALISRYGIENHVRWEGAVSPDATLERFAAASVYVLPSVDEVFPMSVLESLSVGLPTVITDSNGLAETLRSADAAMVVDPSLGALTWAVRDLLADSSRRSALGARGRDFAREHYSMHAVGTQLEAAYTGAMSKKRLTN